MENAPSFQVTVDVDGIDVTYGIIENEGHLGIELDGVLLGEIQCFDEWEQTSGEPFPENVFKALVNKIEDHYE